MASCSNHRVGRWWKPFVIILTPLMLLLPLLLIPDDKLPAKANQCLYVMLLMAVYWCTEALSLAVTACIPIFIFPMLGILKASEVCAQYLTATVMMFVGGIMVALAVEKCNLHKRIAVGILHLVGTKPLWLMLGFMLPTAVLSLWINNTATTAMMLPISEAVIQSLQETYQDKELEKKNLRKEEEEQIADDNLRERTLNGLANIDECFQNLDDDIVTELPLGIAVIKGDPASHPDSNNDKLDQSTQTEHSTDTRTNSDDTNMGYKTTGDAKLDKFAKGITLAVSYAALTGGPATLIGTPPNTILKQHADDIWDAHLQMESPITFTSWLIIGMPVAIINFIIVWLWLTVFFNGIRALGPSCAKSTEDDRAIKRVIEKEYRSLGKLSFAELVVSVMFLAMVLLWFFRSPSFMTGWANLDGIKPGYTHDVLVSIFITILLCAIPSKFPTCRKDDTGPVETLLDWNTIHSRLPWGVVFLIGGGLSLAKASTASGLSKWIAEGLTVMSNWPAWAMVFVLCLITAFLTEITSNSATCTILMPIMSSLAEGTGYNPLYLMIPVGLTTSFAFMLPVSTPPNAIAFSFGRLKIMDMVKAGFILNFTSVGVVMLCIHTWAKDFFKFDVQPWTVNVTSSA
ncbi:hypothetical protein LSH36_15g02108 [Paralvinella palmiformis]|uniref:Uncharacterized protein n=1 Tax=Paralvinella palmiformis TaxID=53620 RepID=A0AAD9KDR4_9ANNE|nr:hypothetical protein LSH36_15g02108 [Paralvinella palmiformis]